VVDNGLKPCATPDDFRFGKDYVVIGRSPGGEKLATRLLDQFFPQSPGGIYHHYTSYGGFRALFQVESCVSIIYISDLAVVNFELSAVTMVWTGISVKIAPERKRDIFQT